MTSGSGVGILWTSLWIIGAGDGSLTTSFLTLDGDTLQSNLK